jgi:hypothetical protein
MATNEISSETLLTNEISNETLDEMFNRGLNIHDDLEICEGRKISKAFFLPLIVTKNERKHFPVPDSFSSL